ncbi:MAG: outer membrane beta-barrel protein [Candidatus Sulfotelmatobacter sp.]|jgi:opacity protein-like surface antigen
MQKISLIVASLLLFAGLASAQVPTSGNVFVGYSFENTSSSSLDFLNSNRANLNGWEATLEGKVFPWVGIVADFAGHYGTQTEQFELGGINSTASVNAHEFTALFGPRVSVSVGKFRPFAEALFGAGHITTRDTSGGVGLVSPSDTSFATALGGGLDYKIIRPVAVRFQGDYVQTRFFGNTQNDVRFSTGIVLRF